MANSKIPCEYKDSASTSIFSFTRRGKTVTVTAKQGAGQTLNPVPTFTKVGTVPDSFKPVEDVIAPMMWGGYINQTGAVKVDINGDVWVYASTGQTNIEGYACFSYSVA